MATYKKGTLTVTVNGAEDDDVAEVIRLLQNGSEVTPHQLQLKFTTETEADAQALIAELDDVLASRSETCEVKFDVKGEYGARWQPAMPALTPMERANGEDYRQRNT